MKSHITDCGIPGIGGVPYGFHMCHFYSSSDVLLDGLAPYFEMGIRKNERCIWIAAAPMPAAQIRKALPRFPELFEAFRSGQLTVFDSVDWYGEPSTLDAEAAVQRCLIEEERAISDGFDGLRIAGNINPARRDHWDRFMEYEDLFHERISGRRILASCSYDRTVCGPIDVMEVARFHHAVVEKGSQYWQVLMPALARNS